MGRGPAQARGRAEPAGLASSGLKPRLATLIAVAVLLLWVGTGQFYAQTGEGRTIGWGEEPLWFPHEAVKFAGGAGMPDRFLSYHNGHASVFEYYHSPEREHGPGRTVYTDPRLEIAGVELFDQYQALGKKISFDQPGWEEELDRLGRPSILVDHVDNAGIGASLLASRHWKCVWFDPIVAVFVHDSCPTGQDAHGRFRSTPFPARPGDRAQGLVALLAAAKGVRNYLNFAINRGDAARPLVWLGRTTRGGSSRPTRTRSRAGRPWARSSCSAIHRPGRLPVSNAVRPGLRSVLVRAPMRSAVPSTCPPAFHGTPGPGAGLRGPTDG